MKMNNLEKAYDTHLNIEPKITLAEPLRKRAELPIRRMLELSRYLSAPPICHFKRSRGISYWFPVGLGAKAPCDRAPAGSNTAEAPRRSEAATTAWPLAENGLHETLG